MLSKLLFNTTVLFFCSIAAFSQSSIDTNSINRPDTITARQDEQQYNIGDGKIYIYSKPKVFRFITNLPKDAAGIVTASFRKSSIKPWVLVAGSTAILILADQRVTDGVRQFSNNIHFSAAEDYKDIINMKLGKQNVSLLKAPRNANTALYQIGQGAPSLMIGAGLLIYGKINRDYRAISTASQLAETFILMGVGTQLLKRTTGRQSPSDATSPGGKWHPFPSFHQFQNHTPFYDAFPSGHLATLMSTVTILADNYPEKKYIKPIGYTITGLVGYAMINNKVHWASDYPLALALGYLCAKQVVKNNRKTIQPATADKHKATLSYTFNCVNGRMMPGVVYKF